MNHDSMIAVIAAHRDGKAIQYRLKDIEGAPWQDLHPACFGSNFATYDYRVKPEPPKPREWCVEIDKNGIITNNHSIYPNTSGFELHQGCIHVREVLPEQEGTNENRQISDSGLLDFADQFCKRRGGKDKFATLGLFCSENAETFRDALTQLAQR